MVHIYTGNGKGKTTAAFGLAMRANGQGLKVIIYQFLKPRSLLCGEVISAKRLKGIRLVRFNQVHPIFKKPVSIQALRKTLKEDFERARTAILSKKYDMVILDEIINAADQALISKVSLLRLLKQVPKKVELILTGRGDVSDMEPYADYVTLMIDKRHPFEKKIAPRKGIEY